MNKSACVVWVTLVLAASLVGASAATAAEHRENRWFVGTNMGGGSAGFTVGSESADREIGAVLGLRAGYGFKPDLAVGLEVTGWLGNVGDVDWEFVVAGPSLTWYPGDRDFFMRGAFGIGNINATFPGGEEAQDMGIGALATLGYEFHIVRTVTFTTQVDYGYINIGDNRSSDFINFGVGFAWYPQPK